MEISRLTQLTQTIKDLPHCQDFHEEDRENLFAAVMFLTAIDSDYLIPYQRMVERINEVMSLPEDNRKEVLVSFFGI